MVDYRLTCSLTDRELKGIVAHELRHNDAWANRASDLSGFLFYWLWFMMTWFFGASLLHYVFGNPVVSDSQEIKLIALGLVSNVLWHLLTAFISRANETMADALSAMDIGSPLPLISALAKISKPKSLAATILGVFVASHPSTAWRTRVLRWLFQ